MQPMIELPVNGNESECRDQLAQSGYSVSFNLSFAEHIPFVFLYDTDVCFSNRHVIL